MGQKENILNLLSEIKDKLDSMNREDVFSSTTSVKSILNRFYLNESPFLDEIKYFREKAYAMVIDKTDKVPLGPKLSELKNNYKRLLELIIKEIELLGIPTKDDLKLDKSIKVNVNQQQSQEQSQTSQLLVFFELIKDEITGKQYKELIQIVKSEKDSKFAKSKIIEKLKSFGENICTNIVTNILTNPSVWGMMAG